jgi:nucleoside-diphosphate-sugar epimerase
VLNIIEMARACPNLEKIEFVSTVGVGGRSKGSVPEEWISTPRPFHNTYEQAKAEAEDQMRAEIARGLPLTVHRPSMVVGDAYSGRIIHFQVFYHLCEFLSGTRTVGLMPNFGQARLDIIPADYVAQVIAWSSRTSALSGRILHSCSGPKSALLLTQLQGTIRAAFAASGRHLPKLKPLPSSAFKAMISAISLFMPSDTRRAVRTLPVFLDYLATDQSFANDCTQALLAPVGLPLPIPTTYLDKVIHYYLDSLKVA